MIGPCGVEIIITDVGLIMQCVIYVFYPQGLKFYPLTVMIMLLFIFNSFMESKIMSALYREDGNLQSDGWCSDSEAISGCVEKAPSKDSIPGDYFLFDSLEVNALVSPIIECDSFVYVMSMFLANGSLDIHGKKRIQARVRD